MTPAGPVHPDYPVYPVDPAELMELAEETARAAADLVVSQRPRALTVSSTKTTVTDIVTEMDQRSEALIVERITAVRPDDGFLGEEGAARAGSSGVVWVVDPIDGTVNYLYDFPAYAVSIGARVGDIVLAGAVVNPVSGETWTAYRGGGAWLDGRPLRPPQAGVPELAMALVATGFGYDPRRRARQADILRQVLPLVRDIRRVGVASLDLCAVASGRIDGFYEQGLKPWDLAAGGLVAEEAGVVVTGLAGREAGEAMVVAAREPLAGRLLALLEGLDADSDPLG